MLLNATAAGACRCAFGLYYNKIRVASHPRHRFRSYRFLSSRSFGTIRGSNASATSVRIGHVELDLSSHYPSSNPHLVPRLYLPSSSDVNESSSATIQPSPTILRHLQWMLSKDALGQDMMLIGPPGAGSHYRRTLAMMYAEMTRREVEILTLSSDITESDLKQRKELVRKSYYYEGTTDTDAAASSTAHVEHIDQAPVRAALHGRLLLLDGLERAERNVLPTLNNLLENREINLDDGRLLCSAKRHQELLASGLSDVDGSFLAPTHPSFRVVALATPAPPYPGRGLDPPLRSRFQIRRVDHPSAGEIFEELVGSTAESDIDREILETLSTFASAMGSAATDFASTSSGRTLVFPSNALVSVAQTLSNFRNENIRSVLARSYPISLPDERFEKIFGVGNAEASRKAFDRACDELGIVGEKYSAISRTPYELLSIERCDDPNVATLSFSSRASSECNVCVDAFCGPNELHRSSTNFVQTQGTTFVLNSMLQEHFAGRDLLLVSPRGEGKSRLATEFASILGYNRALFNLYREMTARDLLQRRATDPITGETRWEDSALVKAALSGDICVLDGVERLSADTLATLNSFLTDRELSLPDSSKLVRHDRIEADAPSEMIRPVHPAFRVIALASMSKDARTSSWLTDDVLSGFSTLVVPSPSSDCMKAILSAANPNCSESIIDRLLDLHGVLTEDVAYDCGVQPLSTRNLLRVVSLARNDEAFDLRDAIRSVLLADLLPPTHRSSLETVLDSASIESSLKAKGRRTEMPEDEAIVINKKTVSIGNVSFNRFDNVTRPEMIPSPEFVDIPNQVKTIKKLLKDMNSGERSFLLLGTQGVGKNKVIDRLCEVCRFEREYIQLHRDSSIGNLTLSPSLEDGKIVWKDSPLIRAVQRGVALVVDEADKAPLEVVTVLKSLVEDGELLLADGRRISRHGYGKGVISMHPNFTLFVLANRPGHPFHGNDFFKTVGDCFSVFVVPNPDLDSEMSLLNSYGPDVDASLIRTIASSFDHLRSLADHGDISYPYSTREAVAVVKHLQKYPEDEVVAAIHNVLDFDSFDDAQYKILGDVFNHYGIVMADYPSWKEAQARVQAAAAANALEIEYTQKRGMEGSSSSPPPLASPKLGKWDEKNEAHVGGNQWAGGTGGSDTAGLGGRGGPYRLDRGHKVHQVSEAAKAQVSEESKRVAKAMAEKALKEKLKDIAMSDNEWDSYSRFLGPIQKDIAILRNNLKSVEGKRAEKSWIKRQSHGEIDDARFVDGLAGDKYIYKRRGIDIDASRPLQNAKKLRFVFDASASMYRFNGYDGRLNRSLEAALMIMMAFDGMGDRFEYSLVAHSGDSPCIPLVHPGQPPKNEKDMMRILQNIVAHTQYCSSGDFTLEGVEQAIEDISKIALDSEEESDESIVICISDANLERYGIDPRELGKIILGGSEKETPVKAHAIFIASFGQEAEDIKRSLPAGRGHICRDSADLPRIVRDILTSTVE